MSRSELSDGDLLDALRAAQGKIPQRDDPGLRHDAWQELIVLVRELERRYPPSPELGDSPDDANDRVGSRAASLLPEEAAAGSHDARGQADAILADSDERSANLEAAPGSFVEHRTSDEATPPAEMGGKA